MPEDPLEAGKRREIEPIYALAEKQFGRGWIGSRKTRKSHILLLLVTTLCVVIGFERSAFSEDQVFKWKTRSVVTRPEGCYNRGMRYETIGKMEVPKIGFGTWQIGGQGSPDPSVDGKSIQALRSALELGYTHFDTAEGYAAGHCEELVGQVIRETGAKREDLFITTKVSPDHLEYETVLRNCENSLRRLGMAYVDLYLIHWPKAGMRLEETFRALNKLVREGKVRHLGVSNFNLKLLKQSAALSETPLLTNQVPYSVLDRTYAKNGVLEYCQQNEILLTAYSPVKPRNIKSNQVLKAVAAAHGASSQQIALAWLAMQPRVITIPMSFNPQHQAENIQATDLVLNEAEMESLNRIRS